MTLEKEVPDVLVTDDGRTTYDCGTSPPHETFLLSDEDGEFLAHVCKPCFQSEHGLQHLTTLRRATNQYLNRTQNLTRHYAASEPLITTPKSPVTLLSGSDPTVHKGGAVIFTDGACRDNGRTDAALAGFGVFFGPESPLNLSSRLPETARHTSQRAEILAAVCALETAESVFSEDPYIHRIVIASDSGYLVNAVTKWIYRWKKHGWKDRNGKHVVNKNLFQSLDRLIRRMDDEYGILVQFRKVAREENEEADRLAKRACGI